MMIATNARSTGVWRLWNGSRWSVYRTMVIGEWTDGAWCGG